MRRIFSGIMVGAAAIIMFAGASEAKVFDVDGKTYDPGKFISECEADGALSKEEANQFREEEKKIISQEEKDRAKHNGQLSRGDAKNLGGRLDSLMKRVDRMRHTKADNTARNLGDQRKESLTPDKQSENKDDIKILGSIRRKLMKDRSLSTNGKNVKVICIKGEITLRGPVDTSDEKARIGQAVAAVAGARAKVQNELEVIKK